MVHFLGKKCYKWRSPVTEEQKEKRREASRRYYQRHKAEIQRKYKERMDNDPEFAAKERARKRADAKRKYTRNKHKPGHMAKLREQQAKYREKNRDKIRARAKETQWHKTHPITRVYTHMKLQEGCTLCGYNKCAHALEFHHRNPEEKEFYISASNVRRRGWIEAIDEMNKCTLLCSNCHREVHKGVVNLD